jgi:hypothetical protein
MAATVLSGTGNVTYTNTTGQNVRVVINFAVITTKVTDYTLTMSWSATAGGTVSIPTNFAGIGRNLAFTTGNTNTANDAVIGSGGSEKNALPTEIMLAAGQTFSLAANGANLMSYNIVIIPEAG